MKQSDLNNFVRKYLDSSKRHQPNIINHDSNASMAHRILVNEVCEWLMDNKILFYTRAYTKSGEIVDIVAPTLIRPFIEVRDSELKKVKLYDPEYGHMRIFVDSTDPFRLL